MGTIRKSAEYNPKFSPNSDGIAFCPKCNCELSEHDNRGPENRWYCNNCSHWIITQPSHNEGNLLGHNGILLFVGLQPSDTEPIEYPGGYIEPYCPICKKPMYVERMWWDRSEQTAYKNKCRLILGYVCEDWKNCGYTQSLKFFVPRESYDYLEEIKLNKLKGL